MKAKLICALIALICIISICSLARAGVVVTPTDLEPIETIEPTPEPTIEPEPTPEPKPEPPTPTVRIYWDVRDVIYEGEEIHIYSEVTNGEYWEIHYQWFRSLDEEEWEPIPDATEPIYTFEATVENLRYSYRLVIIYKPLEEEENEDNIYGRN